MAVAVNFNFGVLPIGFVECCGPCSCPSTGAWLGLVDAHNVSYWVLKLHLQAPIVHIQAGQQSVTCGFRAGAPRGG